MRIWIDIENPPQVQYLLPFRGAFERAGAQTVVTARDYGIALDLLEREGGEFHPVGASYGKGKARKIAGLVGRARALNGFFRGNPRPDALMHAGRASVLVAARLRIPNFSVSDYEHADFTLERFTGAYVIHPDVIDPGEYTRQGVKAERLIPYRGLKEDISFAGLDVGAVGSWPLPGIEDDGLVRVLFRPAAEESHYYKEASGELTLDLLGHLASQEGAVVVFSPRDPRQVAYLDRFRWANPPVVLREAVPFVPLLKAADVVVSSGGTMIREAAYIGIPAYSIYRGEMGGVDRHLEKVGRLRLLSSPADFEALTLEKRGEIDVLAGSPTILEDLSAAVLERLSPRQPGRATPS
jgi:predicted glycosyltransferase